MVLQNSAKELVTNVTFQEYGNSHLKSEADYADMMKYAEYITFHTSFVLIKPQDFI